MASKATEGSGTSSYATGGGGVTLEQTFGGTLLTSLLIGAPVVGLGDGERVEKVALQAILASPVDDFVVYGTERRISFGVRRDPTIAPSDDKFVKLLTNYLRIVIDNAADVNGDKWRLGLVVAAPHTGAAETRELCDFARAHTTAASFRAEVLRSGATTAAVRNRLDHLDSAIDKALTNGNLTHPGEDVSTVSWRLLRALRIVESRLEGDDATDRAHAIALLIGATRGPSEAETLFHDLCRLTGRFATRAGVIDMQTLRRELRGAAEISRAANYTQGWTVLDTCSDLLQNRTSTTLTDPRSSDTRLRIERSELGATLSTAMRSAGEAGTCLIVSGEPDVGKSVLTLVEADDLKRSGSSVVTLSFRDLPLTPLELDQHLGAPAERVVATMAVAPVRMLVLDGAEVVLEGRAELVSYILRAAQRAGVGVVLTTRDDAKSAVATAAGRAAFDVQHFVVPALIEAEVDQIAASFPTLDRVASEPRSRWLLGRPGLVDLLLQSGAHAALPNGALSEADVYAAVWHSLIRANEVVEPNVATPDGREAALIGVVRKMLHPTATTINTDVLAIPSLRRDRILLPLGPTAAWRSGEGFANDLYRDLAAARLLVLEPIHSTIANANAPRWLIRAARLAAQVRLAEARMNQENTRRALQAEFDHLAEAHGDRWRDLVWEALLPLSTCRDVLHAAKQQLLMDDGYELHHLLRVVLQKFCHAQRADVIIVAPVVEFLCDHRIELATLNRSVRDELKEIATYWLAGRALDDHSTKSDPLRVRIRDELLLTSRQGSEFRVYGLALLGPDFSQCCIDELRSADPRVLQPCIEGLYSPMILARYHPELLLRLAERYYIELPDPRQPSYGRTFLHDGVRGHDGTGRMYSPDAAYYYGPFWALLNSRVASATVLFIKRLLDHATRVRITRGSRDAVTIPSSQLSGFEIEHPRLGIRRFIGDAHVWRWYRATGVGPYPCMSALLALERAIDESLAAPGISLCNVADCLLRDGESLAIPGLVVGTLIRYIDRDDKELEPWLTHPLIWHLESDKLVSELQGMGHARDSDDHMAHGHGRRKWMLYDAVGWLIEQAYTRGDAVRLDSLANLGRKLVDIASSMVADLTDPSESDGVSSSAKPETHDPNDAHDSHHTDGHDTDDIAYHGPDYPTDRAAGRDAEIASESNEADYESHEMNAGDLVGPEARAAEARKFLLRVRRWGAMFDVSNYRASPTDGGVELVFVTPPDLQDELADQRLAHERRQAAWFIIAKYSMLHDGPAPTDTMIEDIAFVRDLEARSLGLESLHEMRASVAVAVAAIDALASGALALPSASVEWALNTVLGAASPEGDDTLESNRSVFPWGASRLAARSVARILGMTDVMISDDSYECVLAAARELANSRIDEVRIVFADALRQYWRTPCRIVGNYCGHAVVLAAFRDAVKACRLGPVDRYSGSRREDPLDDPVTQISSVHEHDLTLECLLAPIIATTDCVAAASCVSGSALPLRLVLLETHRRTFSYYAMHNFRVDDAASALAVPRALLSIDDGELAKHATLFVAEARAIDHFLRGLATVATVDRNMRLVLSRIWPGLMDLVLGLIGSGQDVRAARHGGMRAFAALVPRPNPPRGATNIDALMRDAIDGWPSLASIATQIARWVPLAAGHSESVDALVGFLETQPIAAQVQPGLDWIMTLVGADYKGIANRSHFLPGWLEGIREHALRNPSSMRVFQRLLDGLAAANDGTARRLQTALEL